MSFLAYLFLFLKTRCVEEHNVATLKSDSTLLPPDILLLFVVECLFSDFSELIL